MAIEPRAEVYHGLGTIHFQNDDHRAARRALDKAVRLDPLVWDRLTPDLRAVLK